MIKKIHKIMWNFEKEERWINSMASKGLNFIGYSFLTYIFEEGEPGEYIYRTEFLQELPSSPESQAYVKFMEESGVECIDTYMRWAFFRKRASEGPFNLYTDYESRIKHYKRILSFISIVIAVNLFAGLFNIFLMLYLSSRLNSIGIINIIIFFILLPLFISYTRRITHLKKEKQLYE